jgi:tetratricopeptide (TPR) repeat protein
MAAEGVRIFLSCVSDEFREDRDALRYALMRPNVEVKIQEDFKALGGDTLMRLGAYIGRCEAVVHIVGNMTGSAPGEFGLQALLSRHPDIKSKLPPLGVAIDAGSAISYTQWEAWLALYYDRDLIIAAPELGVARDLELARAGESRVAQAEHLERLRAVGCYVEVRFTDKNDLVTKIFAATVLGSLVEAARPARQPRNLPLASLGPLFVGRNAALDNLRAALMSGRGAAVTGCALYGLGGVGKTRLAIEYALRHEADYSALLFVPAHDLATLNANLAELTSAEVLDLPEKEAREDEVKIEAALRWLDAHPTWLMILDKVDDDEAVGAVAELMARLKGGHVIVTARAANFPASVRKLALDALDESAATEFLLERTRGKRAPAGDDEAQARELAHELGGLALGLEQAGAYIARQRIGFARYLTLWREKRDSVLNWFDRTTMSYDHGVGLAAAWAASVEKLTPESRRLLERLAFLAPEPIPVSLLDVPVPGEAADYDAYEARAGLYAYSLATQAKGEDGVAKGFVVHRLVQDFARRAVTDGRRAEAIREALQWVNAAFVGEPDDVRSWPVLDPLAPHALAVARWGNEAGIAEPTAALLSRVGLLLSSKGLDHEAELLHRRALAVYEASLGPDHPQVAASLNNLANLLQDKGHFEEAEPLYRRARAILEARFGPNHPNVAIGLNNLAQLLFDTGRLADAEPLFRRALEIDTASLGPDHPDVAIRLNNLASLLRATNRLAEAEPLYRRALAMGEASLGPDHPSLAIRLNNLAGLLQATNRLGEAEPLYRRALAIDEASLGPDHPSVAMRLNNLARLLQATHHLAEAEPLYRRALAIDEESQGPAHPNVARDLSNLAELLRAMNRLDEAEPLYRRALAIDEESQGPAHPNVARDLNNLARLLQATNRLGEAELLYRRALAIFEDSLGRAHPSTVMVRENIASLANVRSRHSRRGSVKK